MVASIRCVATVPLLSSLRPHLGAEDTSDESAWLKSESHFRDLPACVVRGLKRWRMVDESCGWVASLPSAPHDQQVSQMEARYIRLTQRSRW